MACNSTSSDAAALLIYGNGANSPAAVAALATSISAANQPEREPIDIPENRFPRECSICGISLRF
jgi:hypothetical protein